MVDSRALTVAAANFPIDAGVAIIVGAHAASIKL
jgi:poly-gamma-glutamate capsule biosynthesis protein CapA/YwtB (metallophosphatase superfamily)